MHFLPLSLLKETKMPKNQIFPKGHSCKYSLVNSFAAESGRSPGVIERSWLVLIAFEQFLATNKELPNS